MTCRLSLLGVHSSAWPSQHWHSALQNVLPSEALWECCLRRLIQNQDQPFFSLESYKTCQNYCWQRWTNKTKSQIKNSMNRIESQKDEQSVSDLSTWSSETLHCKELKNLFSMLAHVRGQINLPWMCGAWLVSVVQVSGRKYPNRRRFFCLHGIAVMCQLSQRLFSFSSWACAVLLKDFVLLFPGNQFSLSKLWNPQNHPRCGETWCKFNIWRDEWDNWCHIVAIRLVVLSRRTSGYKSECATIRVYSPPLCHSVFLFPVLQQWKRKLQYFLFLIWQKKNCTDHILVKFNWKRENSFV